MFNKIICFDPPYSDYFNDLSLVLEQLSQKKVDKECFSFNKANKIYLKDYSIVRPKLIDLDEEVYRDYLFVRDIRSLSNVGSEACSEERVRSDIRNYITLENYIRDNKNSIYLIYNDLRWQHAFAVDILKKLGLNYFVFERGVFRPYSTTMDCRGVNANASFCNYDISKDSIKNSKVKSLEKVFFIKRKNRPAKVKFAYYFILSKLYGCFYPKDTKLSSQSKYRKSFKDYCQLLFKDIYKVKSQDNGLSNVVRSDKKFIFVPLQLSNDTQTLINSDFNSTQEFIDRVYRDYVNSSFKDYSLVFKKHPMDITNYQFPNGVIVTDGDTNDLIKRCSICVTINSTVGFEALFHTNVICLGKSFYTEHNIVNRVKDEVNLFSIELNPLTSDEYKYHVLEQYQVPGSIFNYNRKDLIYTSQKIISLL